MPAEANKDILGTGWAFPPKIDGRGGMSMARHEKDIEQSILIILRTAKGERRMRPNFGCDVHNLVFAPNSATTWGLASHYVQEALGWWEPRIEVMEVDTRPDPDDPAKLVITIQYRIKATNDARNIVYPFYLVPGKVQ